MRVLFLARYLPQEGSTTHMYSLARGLMEKKHEVYMISAGPKQEKGAIDIYNSILKDGLIHFKVKFPLKPMFNTLGKVVQLIQYILVTPQVLYIMRKVNPDIIHVHYPVTSYLAKIYCKIYRKKFITTHHVSGIPNHILHRKADYVIAISSELNSELKSKFKYNENQIKLIFNGVAHEKFDIKKNDVENIELRKKYTLPKEKVIIGFIGSFIYRKGIDILLEATSGLDKDQFHLVLVGDGDLNWTKDLINKFNLVDNCNLFEFQDPINFYKMCDILVLPSRQEGFGLVVIEAMMAGVPVVRSNVEGAIDQIDHKRNGYIFENENSAELKHYLDELIHDDCKRKIIGSNAKCKAVSNFTQEIMVNKTITLYEECTRKLK